MSMKRIGLVAAVAIGVLACVVPGAAQSIHIEDVERFYRVYDAAGGRPTAEQLQRDYLDPGSDGLHQFAKLRNITGARIADALAKQPQLYADARRCMSVLPRVRQRLEVALATLVRLYPAARRPAVTIAVGRGRPVGVGYPTTGLQIGLEALCATDWLNPDVEDRFVHVIAHEYAHVQQSETLAAAERPTVLERSLLEGVAEFVGELISGKVAYSQLSASTKGREKEIETAFVADVDKTDLSDWIDNSTMEKPRDLGYWVGYRIAKAFYQRASDKREAVADMLGMTDPKAFLVRSGWQPGMPLP
jgi:hypothetical protein